VRSGRRYGLSAAQKTDIWRRWKAGESLHEIGRALGKDHGSTHFLLSQHGGIVPAIRRHSGRTLTLAEREEISRGLACGSSIREIARRLQQCPSGPSMPFLQCPQSPVRPTFTCSDSCHSIGTWGQLAAARKSLSSRSSTVFPELGSETISEKSRRGFASFGARLSSSCEVQPAFESWMTRVSASCPPFR
jgi:hypothetical protein